MPFSTKSKRDRARKRIAVRVKAGEGCCFCGQPIDLSLPYPDPQAFVVDHQIPTSRGGLDSDYELLRPAHHQCNMQRGNTSDGSIGRNSGVLG